MFSHQDICAASLGVPVGTGSQKIKVQQDNSLTCKIPTTVARLIWNISFTSRETVLHNGTLTLLLRSIKISISSSSSTIENGLWQRATHNASLTWNFGYE